MIENLGFAVRLFWVQVVTQVPLCHVISRQAPELLCLKLLISKTAVNITYLVGLLRKLNDSSEVLRVRRGTQQTVEGLLFNHRD